MALKYDKILGTIREQDSSSSFTLDVSSTNYLRIVNNTSGSVIDFVTAPANTITTTGFIYRLSGITDTLSALQRLDTDIYVLSGSYGTADAIQVNYTPSIYTTLTNTVSGHLDGINSYLNTSINARSGSVSAISGITTNVITVPTSAGGAGIIFNYSANNNAINVRTGIMKVAYTTSAIVYNEQTTADIGSTSAITFTPIISGSNIQVNCAVVSGSSWTVKYTRDLL